MRGSDPDAALIILRMFDAGEDPLYLGRRLVRMAMEDIGLADPQALVIANAAKDAYDYLGSPEGELAFAEATVYLATAPKSTPSIQPSSQPPAAKEFGSLLPPKHILNAPTKLMKEEDYAQATAMIMRPRSLFRPGLFSRKRWADKHSTIRQNAASERYQEAAGLLGEAARRTEK